MDDWSSDRPISTQDVSAPFDISVCQRYFLGGNGFEDSFLATPPNPGDDHDPTYLALVAKDQYLVPRRVFSHSQAPFIEHQRSGTVPRKRRFADDLASIDSFLESSLTESLRGCSLFHEKILSDHHPYHGRGSRLV
jgi:hypothetical protein